MLEELCRRLLPNGHFAENVIGSSVVNNITVQTVKCRLSIRNTMISLCQKSTNRNPLFIRIVRCKFVNIPRE